MKTVFELEYPGRIDRTGEIKIIDNTPKYIPYVSITMFNGKSEGFIKDRDLKLFATNILKSLGYKVTLEQK